MCEANCVKFIIFVGINESGYLKLMNNHGKNENGSSELGLITKVIPIE